MTIKEALPHVLDTMMQQVGGHVHAIVIVMAGDGPVIAQALVCSELSPEQVEGTKTAAQAATKGLVTALNVDVRH